jgi:hypothetical protein
MSDSTSSILSDTTNLSIRPQDMVSPVQDSTFFGHYAVTLNWQIDQTTLLPLGVTQTITLGNSAAGKL